MTGVNRDDKQIRFSWYRSDIEAKLGARGGRFTRVNHIIWLVAAAVLTLVTYVGIFQLNHEQWTYQFFAERGLTQYAVVLLFFWSALILAVKMMKTKLQRRALDFTDLVPIQGDFVLSPATVDQVLGRLRDDCDDTSKFILFNRIDLALSNLKNMGRIGDVDDVLQSQASNDDDVMESSYSLLKGFIWAIPVLGFIGTVMGLSGAIGGFKDVLGGLEGAEDIGATLSQSMGTVVDELSTSFDTTLLALLGALVIQLWLSGVRKAEEELLDDCKEYCQRHIVGKLRLTLFD